MRRIEALTGPEAVALLRGHDAVLRDAAAALRKRPEEVAGAIAELRDKAKAAAKAAAAPANGASTSAALVARAADVGGATVLAEVVDAPTPRRCWRSPTRPRASSATPRSCSARAVDGRVHLVASVAPALVQRGVHAGEVVKTAAEVAGGGGGGRDTMAQAGGRDPERLPRGARRRRARRSKPHSRLTVTDARARAGLRQRSLRLRPQRRDGHAGDADRGD